MGEINYTSLIVGFVVGQVTITLYKFMNIRGLLIGFFRKTKKLPLLNTNDFKMVLVVRTDLNMGKGKIAAQCCHAALASYKNAEKFAPEYMEKWMDRGQPKIVVKLDIKDNEDKLYALERLAEELNVPCSVVHDAGHTQVKRGTATCAGFGPAPAPLIDKITGDFKLL